MTAAYWIVRVSVRDAARYPDHLAAARPAFEKYGARFLVRGGRYLAMEGSARNRNVVVEFADYDTALACYRSPEYQAAKAIREAHAEADLIIVQGAAQTGFTRIEPTAIATPRRGEPHSAERRHLI